MPCKEEEDEVNESANHSQVMLNLFQHLSAEKG